MRFQGFSPETGDFLWGLAFNNERPWFEAHRAEYTKHLLEPFRALAFDTDELMRARFPHMNFQLHISRIYRDARRLHGRGPYKEHLWFSLKDWQGRDNGPDLWFEIGAADYSFGLGYWDTPARMERYRKGIEANPARLETLARRLREQDVFRLGGEEYKRPKGDVGALLNPWYNRKWLSIGCHRDFGEELFDPALPQRLAEGFAFLMPYYEYLLELMPAEGQEE